MAVQDVGPGPATGRTPDPRPSIWWGLGRHGQPQRSGAESQLLMQINPAVLADLHQLTASLDGFDADLPRSVQLFEEAAALAVGSPVAWTLTVMSAGQWVALTSVPTPRRSAPSRKTRWAAPLIRASLRLPLGSTSDPGGGDVIMVMYAEQEHAFDRLWSDLAVALQLGAAELALDQDLDPRLVPGLRRLPETLHQQSQARRAGVVRRHRSTRAGSSGRNRGRGGRLPVSADVQRRRLLAAANHRTTRYARQRVNAVSRLPQQ